MRTPSSLMRVGVALLVALLLAACGGTDSPPPPPSEGQATIGVAGGTVQGPDGVAVVVPPDALAADTTIRIARDATGAPEVGGLRLLTPIYQITPHGAEFDAPVRIRIPFDRAQVRSATAPVILRSQPGSDRWEILVTDAVDGVAAADSFGFSYYAVGECFISADIAIPGPSPIASCPSNTSLRLTLRDGNGVELPQQRSSSGTLRPALTIDAPASFGIEIDYSRPSPGVVDTIVLRSTGAQPSLLQQTLSVDAVASSYGYLLTPVTIDPAQISGASQPGGKNLRIWAEVTRTFDAFYLGCVCWRPTSWTFSAELLIRVQHRGVQPTITQQPANRSVMVGQSATFTVAATAPSALTYQWQRAPSTGAFVDIAAATSDAYTTLPAEPTDNGSRFRARMCTRGGTPPVSTCVFSSEATLSVSQVVVAPAFTQQPQSVSVVQGQTASFNVTATGTPAPTVRWFRENAPGSATQVGPTCTGSADSTNCTYTTGALALADNGVRFYAVAENGQQATSLGATLTVTPAAVAPAIPANEPLDVAVVEGQNATFSVSATGTAPLSYQWRRDGADIAGANGAGYTLDNAQVSDSGARFSVVVTNGTGTATSRDATLTVAPPTSGGVTCTTANPAAWCWIQPAPHSNNLGALALDGTTVHALGWRTHMQSTDNGAAWTTRFVAADPEWRDLAVPSPGVLVAGASQYLAFTTDRGILRSSDSGHTWTRTLSDATVFGLAFSDALNGVAVGDGIWRTTDGGLTWTQTATVSPMASPFRVAVASTGYVTVGHGGLIMRSIDAGLTWTTIASGTTDNLADVAFANATLGIAVTQTGSVLRTTDGGATWSAPAGVSMSGLAAVAFADANTAVAMSWTGPVYRSTDGGLSWALAADLGFEGAEGVQRVRFRSALEGFAVAMYGQVWRTVDGGASWALVAGGSDLQTLLKVKFRFAGFGLAAGSAGIYRSIDAGASWQQVSGGHTEDIAFIDYVTHVAVGGDIRRTTDHGQTWTRVQSIAGSLTAVEFVPPSSGAATTGVAVGSSGSSGQMLRTTDGGMTWTPVTIGTVPGLAAVAFSNQGTGIGLAGGLNRTLLRTTDNGATWTVSTVPQLRSISSIHGFAFTQSGVLMATDDGLMRSIDNGRSWTLVYESPRGGMTSVAAIEGTRMIAVGAGGAIVLSADAGATWTPVDTPIDAVLYSVAYTGIGDWVVAVGDAGTIVRNTQGGAP